LYEVNDMELYSVYIFVLRWRAGCKFTFNDITPFKYQCLTYLFQCLLQYLLHFLSAYFTPVMTANVFSKNVCCNACLYMLKGLSLCLTHVLKFNLQLCFKICCHLCYKITTYNISHALFYLGNIRRFSWNGTTVSHIRFHDNRRMNTSANVSKFHYFRVKMLNSV
jgi:hypothetical protein